MYIYHILLIYLSVDRYLGCFHLLAVVNSAAMDISIQRSIQVPTSNSFGYIPGSGAPGSYGFACRHGIHVISTQEVGICKDGILNQVQRAKAMVEKRIRAKCKEKKGLENMNYIVFL